MGTKIEWCDETWNPIAGCSIVSPACTNCYAMAMAARIERMQPGGHYAGLTQPSKAGPVWTGKIVQAPDHVLTQPLRWKKPRKIFVNSMSDLFHESVPDEWIDRIFAVMALSPQHTFQVLTKRPKRMRKWFERWPDGITWKNQAGWPLPNVWLGVTAEDQPRADERIPDLLATPAAKRFVSIEPMLGPVDLTRLSMGESDFEPVAGAGLDGVRRIRFTINSLDGVKSFKWPGLDWVICGGESGPNARPMFVGHARDLMRQCQSAGVPFFMKQLGADPIWEDGAFLNIRHRSGADPSEWPEDLRVQEFPT